MSLTDRQEKQERHRRWHLANRAVFTEASGLPFLDRGETLCFRLADRPPVDFYPSTGRWRIPGRSKTWSGGATAFLVWYAKLGDRA